MVDEGRVSRLLRGISERVDRLQVARATPIDARGSLWLDGVKYLFVITIEGCVDVAQHIVASEQLGSPDANAAAVRMLADHELLTVETADRVAAAVGFRNVLVHQYAEVDDGIVIEMLDRLGDFGAFVEQVSRWLVAQRPEV